MTTPYIGFGNDTLAGLPLVKVGDLAPCKWHVEGHPLIAADDGNELLLFYRCDDTPMLGAVNHRLVVDIPADVSGQL